MGMDAEYSNMIACDLVWLIADESAQSLLSDHHQLKLQCALSNGAFDLRFDLINDRWTARGR